MHYLQIQTLFRDWQTQWVGARLQKVYQHDRQTLSLTFYGGAGGASESVALFDFSNAQSSLLCATDSMLAPWPLPRAPVHTFAQALRKYGVGHRVVSLEDKSGDRWVRFVFAQGVSLTVELSGRHSNLFLCDAEGLILAQWRKDHSQRRLQGGMLYLPPASPRVLFNRPDPLQLERYTPGERQAVFAQAVLGQRQRFLQSQGLARYKKALQHELTRLETELTRLNQALEDISYQETYQRCGELLQTAFSNPPLPGATSVRVRDYYQPQSEQAGVDIVLNPLLSLQQNIAYYYQRARKVERSAEYALEHLSLVMEQQGQVKAQVQDLESYEQALAEDHLVSAEDWSQLQQEMSVFVQKKAKAGSVSGQKNTAREGILLHARRFETRSVMWVGRSAKDNHQLTFRYAKGSDYWFHVQDSSGSHVLLKASQLNAQILEEAAHLAAYYSPQRQSFERGEPVSVCYTQVKYVKAVKGAAPGRVQMQQFKTYGVRYREACWKGLTS